MRRAAYTLTSAVLVGLTSGALGCGHKPSAPPAIKTVLGSSEILSYRQELLDGVPTLVLVYATQANFLSDWSAVASEVGRVSQQLRAEADRQQLRSARITVKSPSDVAVFDYSRSESGGWEEARRDLVDVRAVPGGGKIGLRSVQQLHDDEGPWMSVAYVTELDLREQKETVRAEATRVLALFQDKAHSAGARKVLLSPSNRIHGGVSVGLLFVRNEDSGKWEPRF